MTGAETCEMDGRRGGAETCEMDGRGGGGGALEGVGNGRRLSTAAAR